MINLSRKAVLLLLLLATSAIQAQDATLPFPGFPQVEKKATGEWWKITDRGLNVPRDQVVAFALYRHDRGVLKLSAQLYPLMPEESREVRLELKDGNQWREVAKQDVIDLGWSAHFRLENWDNTEWRHGMGSDWGQLLILDVFLARAFRRRDRARSLLLFPQDA